MNTMKNIVKHTLSLLAIPFLLSCSESEFNESLSVSLHARYLSAEPSALEFYSVDAGKPVHIESTNTAWEIENSSSWLDVSPLQGKGSETVTYTPEYNHSADTSRVAVNYLVSKEADWNFSYPIIISQSKDYPRLTFDDDQVSFNAQGAKGKIEVSSNFKWTVSSNSTFVNIENTDNLTFVEYSVAPNNSLYSRFAYLFFEGHGRNERVTVYQAAPNVSVSAKELVFENTAGSYKIDIESEVSWTARSAESWIQVSPTSGNEGKSSIEVSVTPNQNINERNGFVYIMIGGERKFEIPVKQVGQYLNTEETKLDFDAKGGELTLHVKSNADWIITQQPEWIVLSEKMGSGNKGIRISASDNNSIYTRSGNLYVESPGLGLKVKVNVSQNAKSFSVDNTYLTFSDKEGTSLVTITTDGKWNATTNSSWISITPTEGEGNATLKVSVLENLSDDDRSDAINLKMGEKSVKITVYQQGKFFTVNSNNLQFDSKGGTLKVNVNTNEQWTATLAANTSWATITPTSGEGSCELMVNVKDNPSVNERNTYLNIETPRGRNIKIVVKQNARYLDATAKSVLFFSKGGTSEIVTINTDGQFTSNKEGDWFTVNWLNGNSFNVTASTNNTGETRRGNIRIQLSDLTEGEMYLNIPVQQTAPGANFTKNGFEEDKTLDSYGDGTYSITISGYSQDTDLNPNGESSFNLVINGYTGDNWWAKVLDGSGNFGKNEYGSDSNQDPNGNSTGDFGKNDYGSDTNQDPNGSTTGDFGKNNYGNDQDADDHKGGHGNLDRNDYNQDTDIDASRQENSGTLSINGFTPDTDLDK